jgi:hypothetical protein
MYYPPQDYSARALRPPQNFTNLHGKGGKTIDTDPNGATNNFEGSLAHNPMMGASGNPEIVPRKANDIL